MADGLACSPVSFREVDVEARAFDELFELSGSIPSEPGCLGGFFMDRLFPRLDMGRWIGEVLSEVDEGSVITFGGIASALGYTRGARGIAEWIAQGRVEGPVHRVVRSDGSVPSPSVEALLEELGGTTSGRPPSCMMVRATATHPPLISLSRFQSEMAPLLKGGDGRERTTFAGLDISTLGSVQASALVRIDDEGHVLGEFSERSMPLFPYIPGLLFYKEAPHLMPLVGKALEIGAIDHDTVLVLDGNGTLHPRGMGIACQLGIALDMASMGIAKRQLTGERGPWRKHSTEVQFSDVFSGTSVIGSSVRRGKARPVYISRGHRMDVRDCLRKVLDWTKRRIECPTGPAHRLANSVRRSET